MVLSHPEGQLLQDGLPVSSLYIVALQDLQLVLPLSLEYCPATHSWQLELPIFVE